MLKQIIQQEEKTTKVRNRKKRKRLALSIGALCMLLFSTKAYMDTNIFKVNRVQFQTDKIPPGTDFTILQISDVHNKVFGDNNEKLLDTVEEIDADIIVLTGDLVDRRTDNFDSVFSLVERLKALNQHVYFVSGNHEWDNPNRKSLLDGLEKRDITILNNQHTELAINNVKLNLAGIDDASTNHEDLDRAFMNVNPESYTVLLSHTPSILDKYEGIPADLILSGHTHGGQVRVPLIGALVAPDQGFFPKLEKGTYEFGTNQFLYIDSGVGTSVAPIRFLNQSQLSVIKISGE
ncbi:metallophosphoesterase [Oceanobacillus polygoni]|uniref:MPP superfamily phosphohydrolase n=1 Tax=Oceanobacillus polygoni TaxID=1235259 RepID=A0A9X1CJK2_9BACI|nr:metallophosphoesterase [Oceanobacillus polygoni]MBP2079855.1 putative MPP superfamily phosphohydrolase [Oceanobacillus polygoni]